MSTVITLEMALEALHSLEETIRKEGSSPVAGVVSCPAGVPIALIRMNGVPSRIATFATHKAYSAAYREASTLSFRDFLCREKLELSAFCNPDLTSIPGGMPVMFEGRCVGSVGISGRQPMEDHELACMLAKNVETILVRETSQEKTGIED